MRSVTPFTTGWTFHDGFDPALVATARAGTPVTLPHPAVALPVNYFDETAYQRPFTYQATLPWRPDFADREVALVFDAAMADATVWLNSNTFRQGLGPRRSL
jgi:beta-galactosidase